MTCYARQVKTRVLPFGAGIWPPAATRHMAGTRRLALVCVGAGTGESGARRPAIGLLFRHLLAPPRGCFYYPCFFGAHNSSSAITGSKLYPSPYSAYPQTASVTPKIVAEAVISVTELPESGPTGFPVDGSMASVGIP